MSHLSTSKTAIKCLKALGQACEELGVELIVDAKQKGVRARGYNSTTHVGDAVVKLKGPYDIAFNRQDDGSYAGVTDWYAGHVAKEVGQDFKGLTDVYTAHRLTNKAKAKGLFVQRSLNRSGGIRLTVTGGKL